MKPKPNTYPYIAFLACMLMLSSCVGSRSLTSSSLNKSEQLETGLAMKQPEAPAQKAEAIHTVAVASTQADKQATKPMKPVILARKNIRLKKTLAHLSHSLMNAGPVALVSTPIQKTFIHNDDVTPAPTTTGRQLDWVGIVALGLVVAAYLSFFVFKAYILAGLLLVAGIIAAVKSLRRCDNRDKYKGKAFPRIAAILGGIGLVLVLLLMLGLAIAVPQVD